MTTFLKAKKAVVVDYKRRVMLPIFLVCHPKSMMRSIFPFHRYFFCLATLLSLLLDDIFARLRFSVMSKLAHRSVAFP